MDVRTPHFRKDRDPVEVVCCAEGLTTPETVRTARKEEEAKASSSYGSLERRSAVIAFPGWGLAPFVGFG